MKLYKYIGFHKAHWDSPLINQELYFASPSELGEVNDKAEFSYTWNIKSAFFNIPDLRQPYTKLFSKTRVLCLAMKLSKKIFKKFCPDGGICYEFIFDSSIVEDLSHREVTYVKSKEHDVPTYIINRIESCKIKSLLKKPALSSIEWAILHDWMNNHEINNLMYKHIIDELSYTKNKKNYADEKEYRIIQLSEQINSVKVITKLTDSSLAFPKLGLQLNCIHYTDYLKVKELQKKHPHTFKKFEYSTILDKCKQFLNMTKLKWFSFGD